jgi:F5/8 type C domain
VRGTVTASVPSGWTATPAPFSLDTMDGPTSTVVDVTVHAADGATGGQQQIPITATSGRTTAHTTAAVLVFGNWAQGTTATASSEHASNVFNGAVRTYAASNAVDGDLGTFWNDDTSGAYPDTLTVTSPAPVALHGVGFASIVDGVPTDFTVQTLGDDGVWTTRATVSGNADVYRWIPFDAPVTAASVRVVVTGSQAQNGAYTRIAELTP